MRWAGWFYCLCVACGGAGAGGAGNSGAVTTPDGGDAPADGGVAADCNGLLPPPPGTAIAFDVLSNANDPMTCGSSTVDGAGYIAVPAPTQSDPLQWKGFGPNGAYWGTFDAPPAIFPQPKGFMGVWGTVSFVMLWDADGSGTPGSTAATAIGPAFGSGGITLSADSQSLTVSKVDKDLNEVASATVSGTFAPRTAAEEASGAVLALTGSGADIAGIWIDLAKGTAGQPFTVGTATSIKVRPMLGGAIAIQLDGLWAGIVQPGESKLRPAPAWLGDSTDFIPALAGRAHAVMPRTGNAVGIVSAKGNSCGSVAFPGVSSVSVGIDGTVVGSTGTAGCTKYVWRNALH